VIYCGNDYFSSNVDMGNYNDPLWCARVEFHRFEDGCCAFCGSEYLGQGTCGENLTWTLTPDGLLTISGTGAMEWEYNTAPWAYCDTEKITAVVIEEGVTTIGNRAFNYCTKLLSVSIPSSIVTIGNDAFRSCYSLKAFNVPDGVRSIGANAFSGCMDATGHLVIPDSVTSIGEAAFASCGITGVTIGSSITEITPSMFSGCVDLKDITIPNGITAIGEWAFQSCSFSQIVIPASVTSIAGNAFSWCEHLSAFVVDKENAYFSTDAQGILYDKEKMLLVAAPFKITSCIVPDTVITIGNNAFGYCFDLVELTLPEGLVTIEDYAFWSTGLTEITIPDSVTTIGTQAFASCDSMTSAILGNGVTSVGTYAFGDAPLSFLRLPGSIEYIGSEAFRDSLTKVVYCGTAESWTQIENYTREYILNRFLQFHEMQDGACIYCSDSGEIETEGSCGDNLTWSFVDGVLTISGTGDMEDFQRVTTDLTSAPWSPFEITEVRIENGVTSIGAFAFEGCTGLTTVTIAPSVTSIGKYAFCGCTGLTAIHIPDGVTNIGELAFESCSGLVELFIPDSVTSVGEQAFRSCTGLRKVTIGNGITAIAPYMFAFCDSLTSVAIPDGVTSIEYSAFQGCEALTTVRFPVSVTSIGYESFKDCSGLTTVIYCGTPEQWDDVWIMTYNNGFLLKAEMQYHDFQDGLCVYCGLAGVSHVWVEATCTTPKTCSICGATAGEALGHSFQYSITVVPTQTTEGALSGSCQNCDEVQAIVMPVISKAAYTWRTQSDPEQVGQGIATYVWNDKTYGEQAFCETFRYGDLNGDDLVNLVDVLMLRKYLANRDPFTGEAPFGIGVGADVNGDDAVDLSDGLFLRRYLANRDPFTGESAIVLGPQ
jgi:hypothetical protein